jgi:hypothetical protein
MPIVLDPIWISRSASGAAIKLAHNASESIAPGEEIAAWSEDEIGAVFTSADLRRPTSSGPLSH